MSTSRTLTLAWLILLLLSAVSTLLASGLLLLPPKLTGSILLLVALFKARVILADYLALRNAPVWRRGFSVVIAGFVALLAALFLAAWATSALNRGRDLH